jgi:hypothetical protein
MVRSGFSLPLAIAIVLGPTIFICIIVHRGASAVDREMADNPANEGGLHKPLVFCSYLDDHNQIQAKEGPCPGKSSQITQKEGKATVPSSMCLSMSPDQTFHLVNCADIAGPALKTRDEHLPAADNEPCLRNTSDDYFDSETLDASYDQGDLLERARPGNETLADKPELWTGTTRCSKGFCDWAQSAPEIERRCYDANPKTPPPSDQALKYTAPFECNVCLENKTLHPDHEHIARHCKEVMMRETRTT